MLFVSTFHAEYIHKQQKDKTNKEQALDRLIERHDPTVVKSSSKSNIVTKDISNSLNTARRLLFGKKNNTIDF